MHEKSQARVAARLKRNPHRSFRRTYREDYMRELHTPGILVHLVRSLQVLVKNWKIFLPLLILAVLLNVLFVGLMSEDTYTQFQETFEQVNNGAEMGQVAKAGLLLATSITTGGLSGEVNENSTLFLILILIVLWLTTIYVLRQRMARHKVKLRDGLYNAMAPLIPTVMLLALAVVECVPIMLTVIVYSAAIQTGFLATPLYALLVFIFALLMILLSGYLLAGTLMALVAVSAPGLYPLKALNAANDLMVGRRSRFLIRLVVLVLAVTIVWVIVMIPVILLDLTVKQNWAWTEGFPLVPLALNIMMCLTVFYVTAYLYIYYRWMLDNEEGNDQK